MDTFELIGGLALRSESNLFPHLRSAAADSTLYPLEDEHSSACNSFQLICCKKQLEMCMVDTTNQVINSIIPFKGPEIYCKLITRTSLNYPSYLSPFRCAVVR